MEKMEKRTGCSAIRICVLIFLLFGLASVGCYENSWNFKGSDPGKTTNSNSLKIDGPHSHFTGECDFQLGNLTCRQVLNLNATYLSTISSSIVNIDIVQGQFQTIKESGLLQVTYPALRRLSIRNSALEIVESLPDSEQLIELYLTNNSVRLVRFNNTVLQRLQILNLTNNNLDGIQDLSKGSKLKMSGLDLSGNEWDCRRNFSWILKLNESGVLVNGDQLLCWDSEKTNSSWFTWSFSLLEHVKIQSKVQAECKNRTAGCSCRFVRMGKEGRAFYRVKVDCSYQNMTSLPKELPEYTDELDVSGNYLTNLDQIKNYHNESLKTILADSNRIESILNIANSKFMANFSLFSLKHNLISPNQIPLDDLVKVPNGTFQTKYVYLYNNSWECDCKMAIDVRNWLWKNHHVVNDSSLLLCSRDGRKIPVLYLLPDAVCPSSREGQLYRDDALSDAALAEIEENKIKSIHYVIYFEVALIVILGLMLAYDSWNYFRHGQLPWIATKLL